MIEQDVDETEITYAPVPSMTESVFRENIRKSMQFDNATLLFPDGLVSSVNLDSGFFTRAARRIYSFKTAAFKRNKRIGPKPPVEINANDIIRSHCPTYIDAPYGARTRISTCVSIGLTDPHMYFIYCKTELGLTSRRLKNFAARLDSALVRHELPSGDVLYAPYVIVCHDTRYKENSLTGLTRILGIGRFGEFSAFSFEPLTNQLVSEMKRKKVDFGEEHVFAEYNDVRAVGILRTYSPTNPGKRSLKYRMDVLSPQKDLGLDLKSIAERARERYQIREA
jgi:hypothetical protein